MRKDLCNLFEFKLKVSTPSVTSDEYNLHDTKGMLGQYASCEFGVCS
jgi:hypothetical protein